MVPWGEENGGGGIRMPGKQRKIPATRRLALEWEKRILSGELHSGDSLPSMRALAEERKVDLSSVLGAYRLLEKRRLIVREQGRGCYVGRNLPPRPVPFRRLYGFHENYGEDLGCTPDEFVCFDFGPYNDYPRYFDFLKERIEREPGLILMDENMLPAMAEEGLLRPLDSLLGETLPESLLEEIAPICRQVFRYRSATYALPLSCLPVMAFFNRRLFDEAGIALPGEDWSWKSLFRLLNQFTLFSKQGRFERGAMGLLLDPCGCLPIITQFGGEVFDRNANCAFDSDAFFRGLCFFEKIIRHLGCCVHKWGDKREYLGELLADGRIAFILGSEQDAAFARERLPKDAFYELPLPGYAAGQKTAFSALGVGLSAGRYDPAELLRFLAEFYTKENLLSFAKKLRSLPVLDRTGLTEMCRKARAQSQPVVQCGTRNSAEVCRILFHRLFCWIPVSRKELRELSVQLSERMRRPTSLESGGWAHSSTGSRSTQ